MRIQVNSKLAAQLNYVQIADKNVITEGNFPDFMIVGPQRTGTTWLTANLRHHPEIFLSYPKELYFFNRLTERNSAYSLHRDKFSWDVTKKGLSAVLRELVKVVFLDFYKAGRYQANQLEWYIRFFQDDDLVTKWIKRIEGEHVASNTGKPRVRGEATASYAVLDPEVIQDIVTLNPDIRIILMIRDPVERAWSHAKKDLVRDASRQFEEVPAKEFIEYLSSDYMIKCGRYMVAINNWESYLKPGHLFIGLYRDIKKRPDAMLMEIFDFLGVENNNRYVNQNAGVVVNKTNKLTMPKECREFLETIFSEEKVILESKLGRAIG